MGIDKSACFQHIACGSKRDGIRTGQRGICHELVELLLLRPSRLMVSPVSSAMGAQCRGSIGPRVGVMLASTPMFFVCSKKKRPPNILARYQPWGMDVLLSTELLLEQLQTSAAASSARRWMRTCMGLESRTLPMAARPK